MYVFIPGLNSGIEYKIHELLSFFFYIYLTDIRTTYARNGPHTFVVRCQNDISVRSHVCDGLMRWGKKGISYENKIHLIYTLTYFIASSLKSCDILCFGIQLEGLDPQVGKGDWCKGSFWSLRLQWCYGASAFFVIRSLFFIISCSSKRTHTHDMIHNHSNLWHCSTD